jgi:flagellar biosynthesis protein FlhF
MRVKRYVADSIQEAIARVKNDLGRDAIILHTKPFKEGGFFGLFCKRRFEVIAAIDENPPDYEGPVKEKNTARVETIPVVTTVTPVESTPASPVAPAVTQTTPMMPTSPVTLAPASKPDETPSSPVPNPASTRGEELPSGKLVNDTAGDFPGQKTPVEPDFTGSIREELAEMRELIRQVAARPAVTTVIEKKEYVETDNKWFRWLKELNLADEFIDELLDEAGERLAN